MKWKFIDIHESIKLLSKKWILGFEEDSNASLKTCMQVNKHQLMQVNKHQLELDMEQQTGSKLGTEYTKAVYCHPAYLTYMQNTSWEMLDWMKHKLESRFQEKYQ